MKISKNKCPLCLSESIKNYDETNWKYSNISYVIKECEGCGSAFTFPLPTDKFLEQFYKSSFNFKWYKDHISAKLRDSRIRFNEYKKYLGKSCLDYGGGLGYFSEVCRDNGLKSITFDPYTTDISDCRNWDSVVSLHALEHSNTPEKFIKDIHSKLRNGGKLILAVPNFDGLGYRKYKMDWVWAQPPYLHIFHLSTKGVIELLERNGFSNITVSYHERWDANNYSDVFNREKYAKIDALWSNPFINKLAVLRKLVAVMNSWIRRRALNKSLMIKQPCKDYSELQVIATKGS
jgi:SAM-dependent methyltransferase